MDVSAGKLQYATVATPTTQVQTNVARGISMRSVADGVDHRIALDDRPRFNRAVRTLWESTPPTMGFDRDLSAGWSVDVNAWNASTKQLAMRTWQYHSVDAMPQTVRDVYDALHLLH